MGMLFLGMWEPLLYNLGFKNFVYVFMGAMIYACLNESEKNETKNSSISTRMNINNFKSVSERQINMKSLVLMTIVSLAIGIIVSAIYLGITNPPSALYGDKEKNESGKSLGMEAIYLTETEIQQIKENGDLVIGYTDSQTPMYKYDSVIANIEYKNRVMSDGVWSGMLVFLIGNVALLIKTRNKSII